MEQLVNKSVRKLRREEIGKGNKAMFNLGKEFSTLTNEMSFTNKIAPPIFGKDTIEAT